MKRIKILLTFIFCAAFLSGCFFRPYVSPVQQGKILSKKQTSSLRLGMNKVQVRNFLGCPLMEDLFSKDYWSYVSTKQVNGGKIKKQHLNLTFENNRLVKIEQ